MRILAPAAAAAASKNDNNNSSGYDTLFLWNDKPAEFAAAEAKRISRKKKVSY
jgi:hypothetical protein